MLRRHGAVLLSLGLALGAAAAWAEDAQSHATAHETIMIDSERVVPQALTMKHDEVLEFENYSFNPMRIVFIEPKEQADKIRCHLINPRAGGAGRAPWLLFGWGAGHRLTAIIPPGRFASVCSLAPGQYAYVAQRAGRDVRAPVEVAGPKGTITVE